MLTDYYPDAVPLHDRLKTILDDEVKRRESIGLPSLENIAIKLVVEQLENRAFTMQINGIGTVFLNALTEVQSHKSLSEKYAQELNEIDQWITQVKPLVGLNQPYVMDNGLFEVLANPESLGNIELTDRAQEYLTLCGHVLKHNAKIMEKHIGRMVPDLVDLPLDHLRYLLRHELEHLNPDYLKEEDNHRSKEKELNDIFNSYFDGNGDLSTDTIRKKTKTYLSLSSRYLPDTEVRAFFCQDYDSENETADTLRQKRKSIEDHLVKIYMPNVYLPQVTGAVVRQWFMESINKNESPDLNTLHYVQNIVYQGTSLAQEPDVDVAKVNVQVADKLFKEIGFWMNKYMEGIRISLDKAESFYLDKI